ncbi:Regucalcin-like 1 [Homarus americanus]|uniref:Regucalcin-like 1 n=1 Tax=Homarus americanus TaxID=6706 RepID=A0A8J5K1K4_HOMAM|nr:Regucalcin-like 1 [Homarus americanus]
MSNDYEVEPVTDIINFGEGPHWSVDDQALYFVDMYEQLVRRYHPTTDTHTKLHIEGGPITLVVPHKNEKNTFVVSIGRNLAAVTWPDPNQDFSVTADDYKVLATVEQDLPDNRFNDGKCDANGRMWAGTMSQEEDPDHHGSLYRLDGDRTITKMVDKLTLSNGMAWTEDNTTMYHIDTNEYKVNAFTFDLTTGTINGMTIDTDGNLWVAGFGSGTIFNIEPSSGKVLRKVGELPSSETTSVSWGGPDLDHLFITTGAGPVYRVTGLGVKGRPGASCTVELPDVATTQ